MTNSGQDTHTVVLRRVGWALMALCAIDMLLFVMTLVWYTGHIKVSLRMLVLFGVASLLLQNSLRTAVWVRWLAVFFAVTTLGGAVYSWWLLPMGFLKAQWTLNTNEMRADLYATLFNVIVCLWVARELSQSSLMEVLSHQWRRSLDLRIAAGAGGAMLALTAAMPNPFTGPSHIAKAKELARDQVSPAYQLHVEHITHHAGGSTPKATAVVWAWTERDLKRVQVRWTKTD